MGNILFFCKKFFKWCYYIGYALFGIVGVVLGPVSYVIIEQLMMKEDNNGEG